MGARDDYLQRQQHEQRRSDLETIRIRWRGARQASIVALIAVVAVLYWSSLINPFVVAVEFFVGFTAFTMIAGFEQRAQSRELAAEHAVELCQASLARIDHRWDEFDVPTVSESVQSNQLATDLDLFGPASVMQRICMAESSVGRDTLAKWLLTPADPDEIQRRQRLVAALANEHQWRFDFQYKCAEVERATCNTSELVRWANARESRLYQAALDIYCWLVPCIAAAITLLLLFDPGIFVWSMVAFAAVNFSITTFSSGAIHGQFRRLSVGPFAASFQPLSAAFAHIGQCKPLKELLPNAVDTGNVAAAALKRLERLHALGSLSSNPFTMIYVYLPLQVLLLWDQQLDRLTRKWKTVHGAEVADWAACLGQLEAMSSLAGIAYENPEWAFPIISASRVPEFSAKGLGHPLIHLASRVCNDVDFGPPGSMLLITGSNMGGKSTVLRAVGVAVVFAQCGAPCCCTELKMSPLEPLTSIKASDSLAHSRSLFMAQLHSIKHVIDRLKRVHADDNVPPAIYLLDEILNGTNTSDRRTLVEQLIGFTLQCRAIGAITSHDLQLAADYLQSKAIRNLCMGHHTTEMNGADDLHFDYKLRNGISTEGSAVILARILGLDRTAPTEEL